MDSLPPPAPQPDALALTSSPAPAPTSSSVSQALAVTVALLLLAFIACVAIALLLRRLSRRRQPSPPAPAPGPRPSERTAAPSDAVPSEMSAAASDATPSATTAAASDAAAPSAEVHQEMARLVSALASLPHFTTELAAPPKPHCVICISPIEPDADLRLLPACRHAFHAACIDPWLRTTPSCPQCRAAVSLPASTADLGSFRVDIGSGRISSRRRSSPAAIRHTYPFGGSFDYRDDDEEVEAIVARIATRAGPQSPGDELAEAAGSRGWLRDYMDRLSGRWSHQEPGPSGVRWECDPEATRAEPGHEVQSFLSSTYRWLVGY